MESLKRRFPTYCCNNIMNGDPPCPPDVKIAEKIRYAMTKSQKLGILKSQNVSTKQ